MANPVKIAKGIAYLAKNKKKREALIKSFEEKARKTQPEWEKNIEAIYENPSPWENIDDAIHRMRGQEAIKQLKKKYDAGDISLKNFIRRVAEVKAGNSWAMAKAFNKREHLMTKEAKDLWRKRFGATGVTGAVAEMSEATMMPEESFGTKAGNLLIDVLSPVPRYK